MGSQRIDAACRVRKGKDTMPRSMDALFAIVADCVQSDVVTAWLDERAPAQGREKGKEVVATFAQAVGKAALAGYSATDCNLAFVKSFADAASPDVVRSLKSRVLCMFYHPQSDAVAADWARGNLERYTPTKVEDRVRTGRRWYDSRKALESVMTFVSVPCKVIGERSVAAILQKAVDNLLERARAIEEIDTDTDTTDTDTDTDN